MIDGPRSPPAARRGSAPTRSVALWVLMAVVSGAALRLAVPSVFTYLDDEKWTFERVMSARSGEPWATLGMASSTGVKNAPMSVWAFIFLGTLCRVSTPEGLTAAVAGLAIVAHVAVLAIPFWLTSRREERTIWVWAAVVAMTNPILVFIERKIWAQSVLPIFDVALLCAWMRRETRAGSFAWGVLGAVIGQIHMAGFFFAPALALFTRLLDEKRRARWPAWLTGSVLGVLPAVPWLLYLLRERPPLSPSPWWLRFRLEFYEYFVSDPSAMCISYVIGDDAAAALKYPLLAGRPTYLMALAMTALTIASLAIAVRVVEHAAGHFSDPKSLFVGDRSDTGILLSATLLGMGALMTLPSISIHRHYMLAAFPLPWVWTARAALRRPGGEKWLAILAAGGLAVSAALLSFVTASDGAHGFGKSWAAQMRDGTSTAEAKDFRARSR